MRCTLATTLSNSIKNLIEKSFSEVSISFFQVLVYLLHFTDADLVKKSRKLWRKHQTAFNQQVDELALEHEEKISSSITRCISMFTRDRTTLEFNVFRVKMTQRLTRKLIFQSSHSFLITQILKNVRTVKKQREN